MKPRNSLRLLVAAGLSLGVVPQLYAAGTTAGQVISNTATVEYEVGGVDQTPVDSNTTTFVVDRMIDLTVAEVGGAATDVVPGSTGRVTTFTVTNDSNSVLDFRLSAANLAGDDFQATITGVFVESGATAGYQALEDTATYIDELAVAGSRTVYVIATIPGTVVNGDDADVTLTAIAAQSVNGTTGAYVATAGTLAADAAETNTTDPDDTTFVDTVFADDAGDATGDVAYDGRHSDTDTYSVVTASLSVTKGSTVVTDPFNCTTPGDATSCTTAPKAVPGAVVEYCLDVENLGASTADSIVLTDGIPANTTYVASSIKTASTGTGAACDVGSGTAEVDAAGGDGDFLTTPLPRGSVVIRSTSIAAGDRFKAVFRVTVD